MQNELEIPKKNIRGKDAIYSSGDKYGYLTLTGKAYFKGTYRYVECICECGKIWFTLFRDVKKGKTKSCGCRRIDFIRHAHTKHGMTLYGKVHPIYRAWHQMQDRCAGNTEDTKRNYTDRGIIVCTEWVNSFDLFYNWALENGWRKGLTLDRIDNEFGNYQPDNCRWGTHRVQNRNKRSNVIIEAFGESKCMVDWSEDSRCKVGYTTLKGRLSRWNWEPEIAILTPPMNKDGRKKRIYKRK